MDVNNLPRGYVINQYQYAKRYRYNNKEFIQYFNYKIEKNKENQKEELSKNKYENTNDYLTFGEFDLVEIFTVDSFRKYHDVSNIAKNWLGKRQSVLLYDISDDDKPTNMYFDRDASAWKICNNDKDEHKIEKNFFCLSMFSLTNEISESVDNLSDLLKNIRKKILDIVDTVNKNIGDNNTIQCEVFGTFNTSEIAVVWLSDQYVDILRVLDSIKHIKMTDKKDITHSVFLTSYSTIGIEKKKTTSKFKENFKEVKGNALVQIAIHDSVESYEELKDIAKKITEFDDEQIDKCLRHSVGEYDLVIEVPASKAVELICRDGYLHVAKRKNSSQADYSFKDENLQKVLKSNIKLFYNKNDVNEINNFLNIKDYVVNYEGEFAEFKHYFEYKELIEDNLSTDEYNHTNEYFYTQVRDELKNKVRASAGAVDTLDLLYTDYKSVISTAYNAIWVSDFHRQFKSVLRAIHMLIKNNAKEWSWEQYLDLTNSFKQQIYHLSQSSRMFFETPRCHLRSTGQYDYLMHSYYGITKQIIEVIYLMQDIDPQSELVPLITVNNVPQVKSQLYFEVGSLHEMRTINLDVPNSIIFDFHRGTKYLTHELFHYAVPNNRVNRNYCMGLLVITLVLKRQVLHEIRNLLKTGMDLPYNADYNKIIDKFFIDDQCNDHPNDLPNFTKHYIFDDIDENILALVKDNYADRIYQYIEEYNDQLFSVYKSKILEFCLGEESNDLFDSLFKYVFWDFYKKFMKYSQKYENCCKKIKQGDSLSDDESDIYNWLHEKHDILKSRIEYCNKNKSTFDSYIQQFYDGRIFDERESMSSFKKMYEDKFINQILTSIREAGPDIAMVSLNGMSVDDYMLFSIQTWQDTKLITPNINNPESRLFNEVALRVSLVMEYFIAQKRKGWNLNTRVDDKYFLNENTTNSFIKKYIWFYTKQRIKSSDATTREEAYNSLVKEAKDWIDFFAESYREYLRNYALFYKDIFSNILKDFDIEYKIELYKNNNKKEEYERVLGIKDTFASMVNSKYNELFNDLPDELYTVEEKSDENRKYLSGIFKHNLFVANLFQKQKTLKELFLINNTIQKNREENRKVFLHDTSSEAVTNYNSSDSKNSKFWEIKIYSLNELLFYMKYCIEDFTETAKTRNISNQKSVWFRGQTSGNYSLLPTVIRNFSSSKSKEEKYKNVRCYQQREFEEFKFRADGAPEMVNGKDYTQSDYIALMQHYDVSTNFLDWSENAFPALYFALKYYYKDAGKGKDRDVVLYLLHPGIYNAIRRDKIKHLHKRIITVDKALAKKVTDDKFALFDEKIFNNLLFSDDQFYTNLIPNLSMENNEKLYNMFLLGNIEYDKYFSEQGEKLSKKLGQSQEWKDLFMPLAVWTSRLNSRIRAQSGCFVAFNLYAPYIKNPIGEEKKIDFEYVSLEEIQKRNLDNIENQNNNPNSKITNEIFLYKLVLDKECCDDIVKWLKGMGVSNETVYPELDQLKGRFE